MNKLMTQKYIGSNQINYPTNKNLNTSKIMEETLQQVSPQLMKEYIQQLELKVQLDRHSSDYQQVRQILQTLLSYPSTKLAQVHRQSNKLGKFDLIEVQKQTTTLNLVDQPIVCICQARLTHSNIARVVDLKNRTNNQKYAPTILKESQIQVQNNLIIGISTFLYFQTIINLSILLIIAFFVFSIFALATNIVSSDKVNTTNTIQGASVSSNSGIILLSLGSKIYLSSDYVWQLIVQTWLGVALIAIWFGIFIALKFFQQKQCNRVQEQCISASDYSIIIEGIPINLKKQDLQIQFKKYVNEIKQTNPNIQDKYFEQFKVQKLNIARPFFYQISKDHSQKLQYIYEKIQNSRKKLIDLILERKQSQNFLTNFNQRKAIIQQFTKANQQKDQEHILIIQQVKKAFQQQSKQITTTGFITLNSNYSKKLILLKNDEGILSKIRNFLTCFVMSQQFVFQAENQIYKVKISQASQPQDIIWSNIGLSKFQIFKRRLLTFLITFVILGISFVITYGLSTLQNSNKGNRYISIIISLVISFFNFVILQALCYLTYYQRDFTSTKRQTSLAVKAVIAQLINSILIPILVNRFIKNKNQIYQKNGLAEDIFILGITSAMASPIAKIIDISYVMVRVIAWYKNLSSQKFHLDQLQLNKYFQLMQFQPGYQYVYIINLFLFNCFFMSLQPIIVCFAVLGYLIMYWAQKYTLFHKCRRPVPGTKILNDVLVQFIYAGPLFYSLGSLTFINLLPKDLFSIQLNQTLVANLIAIGISLLIILLPYSIIYQCIMRKQQKKCSKFQQNRIFLPSQYDRLNPKTADQAFREYMTFIQEKRKQIDQESNQIRQRFVKILDHQGQHNFDKKMDQPILEIFRDKKAIDLNKLLNPQIQPLNPNLIKMHLLPDQANCVAPYLVQSCIRGQKINPGLTISKILSDDMKLGFTQMPRRNIYPQSSVVQNKDKEQQKNSQLRLQQDNEKLIPSLVDIVIPSNNKISNIYPQKQYVGIKQTNPLKNPLFNLYRNPYNPDLMQTFRMKNQPNLGQSHINFKQNVFVSKFKNNNEPQIKQTKSQFKQNKDNKDSSL